MTTKEFAEQFNISEVFLLRMKELFASLETTGLGPEEYGDWRIKAERLTCMLMSQITITDTTILDGKL
jgi:hypothetical protein